MKQRLLIGCSILVALSIGGMLFVRNNRAPETTTITSAPIGSANLHLDFGDGRVTTTVVSFAPEGSAFTILEQMATDQNIPLRFDPSTGFGVFVRQIGDKKNGADGRFWQYWVNGKFPLVAADRYMLSAGDTVEWRFVVPVIP